MAGASHVEDDGPSDTAYVELALDLVLARTDELRHAAGEADPRMVLHVPWNPSKPVLWLGHDVVARRLAPR